LRPRFNPVVKLTSPPRHLDAEEQALFRALVAEFQIDDSASSLGADVGAATRRSLLTVAMEAHQRAPRRDVGRAARRTTMRTGREG
jgi:hypothetical protein